MGSLSSITMIVLLRNNPIMVVVGAVILVVALVGGVTMAFTARGNAARQRRVQRERYLDYLETTRARLAERAAEHRTAMWRQHPDPQALIELTGNAARRWERRPGDADFLRVRAGVEITHAAVVEILTRFVVICGGRIIGTRRRISASRYFQLVAYAITVGIKQAGARAIVVCLWISAALIIHIGYL